MTASSLPLGAILVMLGAPAVGWAEPEPPSARAQAGLARAKAAIEVLFDLHSPPENKKQAAAALDRGLDDLAGAVDEATAQRLTAAEAESIDAKLVAIAWDRRLHPERHRELLIGYQATNNGGRPFGASPPPEERHLKEEYRLAWEYRLLNPEVGEAKGFFIPPTFEALRRIGNETSIPTVVYYFRHRCRDDDEGDRNGTYMQWAIGTVESYRSAKALTALLECVAWTKRQWATLGPGEFHRNFSPEKLWIANLVSEKNVPEQREQWRKVMTAFPRDKLPTEQRRWLDDALKSP